MPELQERLPTDREIRKWMRKNNAKCCCSICVEMVRYQKSVMELIK